MGGGCARCVPGLCEDSQPEVVVSVLLVSGLL